MGDHSFISVESKDFHNLIHSLQKDVSIPSADTIKKEIIDTFNNNTKKIKQILQVSYICLLLNLLFILN
jgi:hypothetical protein